jgi:hypothetical protein
MTDVSDILAASIITGHRTSETSVNFYGIARRSIPEVFFIPAAVIT